MATYTQNLNKKGGEYQLKLEVNQKGQNVLNNTTNVEGYTYIYKNSSSNMTGTWNNNNSKFSMNIGGNTRSGETKYNFRNKANYGREDLVRATFTIKHNDNGSKSISVSASFTDNGGAIGSGSIARTQTLTTIPRQSNVTTFVLHERTMTELTYSWATDRAVNQISYRHNAGSWVNLPASGTSGRFTVSNLTPGVVYRTDFQARNASSNLWSGNRFTQVSTYPLATGTIPNINMKDSFVVTINRPTYSTTENLTFQMRNDTGAWVNFATRTGVTSSPTVKFTTAEVNTIMSNRKNGKTTDVRVHVQSYWNGSSKGGNYTNTSTLTLNMDNRPAIGAVTYYDTLQASINLTKDNQKIVQNNSNIRVKLATVTANNYATLDRVTITIGTKDGEVTRTQSLSGTTQSNVIIDYGKINTDRDATATIVLYDSRGYTSQSIITITIVPYSSPTLIGLNTYRLNDYEEPSYIKGTIRVATIAGNNKPEIRYRIRLSGTDAWGAWTSINLGTPNLSGTFANVNFDWYISDLPNDKEYEVQAQTYDTMSGWGTVYPSIIRRGIPLLKFEEDKLTAGVRFQADKGIISPDTRDVNLTPDQFYLNHGQTTVTEFKRSDVLGVPSDNAYSDVTTYTKWKDRSGGTVDQVAISGDGMFKRSGQGASWNQWSTLAMGHNDDKIRSDSREWHKRMGPATYYIHQGVELGYPESWGHVIHMTPQKNGKPTSNTVTQLYVGGSGSLWTRRFNTEQSTDWVRMMNFNHVSHKIKDYIVDEGKSGIWRWEKWNSGKYICIGRSPEVTVNITNTWGAIYASSSLGNYSYPSPFIEPPTTDVTWDSSINNAWVMKVSDYKGSRETQTGPIQLLRGTSLSGAKGFVNWTVTGRWK